MRLLASLAPAALAILATLAGCASTPAPSNTALQGSWQLDGAASDDASARIASAIRTAQERRHRRFAGTSRGGAGGVEGAGEAGPGAGPGEGPDGADSADFGPNGQIGPDFQQLRQRLQQTLGSPQTLTLQVQPDEVLITRDNLPARDYQPGERLTRFEEYGTALLSAAWKERDFVLAERYTSGARLQERYALDGHGALVYTRTLRDPTLGRIEIRSLYHRKAP
jgi:hypothetical protein